MELFLPIAKLFNNYIIYSIFHSIIILWKSVCALTVVITKMVTAKGVELFTIRQMF